MKIKHCKYERGIQLILTCIYLPSATKLRQGNIFTGVCQSFCSRGGLPQCTLGYTPRVDTPSPGQTPTPTKPITPPSPRSGKHNPQSRKHDPPRSRKHIPKTGSSPPPEGHSSERYASYWNAFLFSHDLT